MAWPHIIPVSCKRTGEVVYSRQLKRPRLSNDSLLFYLTDKQLTLTDNQEHVIIEHREGFKLEDMLKHLQWLLDIRDGATLTFVIASFCPNTDHSVNHHTHFMRHMHAIVNSHECHITFCSLLYPPHITCRPGNKH